MPNAAANSQVNSFTSFPCCCLGDPYSWKTKCPISFQFLTKVLSDCKYLWRAMQLLDQGFTCLLFCLHISFVYSVHLSCFVFLELCLLYGARIMLLFMLTQPQSFGHFVPQAGNSPDREHQGKIHAPLHTTVWPGYSGMSHVEEHF